MKFTRKFFSGNYTAVLLPVLIIAVVSFAVYFNTLSNGFVYDDNAQISANPWIRDIRSVPVIFSQNVWSFRGGGTSNYYRPLMHIIYMFTYYLFGLAPWGFHLVNILFHAANSVLVFFIASRLPLKAVSSEKSEARRTDPVVSNSHVGDYSLFTFLSLFRSPFICRPPDSHGGGGVGGWTARSRLQLFFPAVYLFLCQGRKWIRQVLFPVIDLVLPCGNLQRARADASVYSYCV